MWHCRLTDRISILRNNALRSFWAWLLVRRRQREVRKTWYSDCISGPSLVLKKGCLHRARLGYTPLVEVNQAINAWSF